MDRLANMYSSFCEDICQFISYDAVSHEVSFFGLHIIVTSKLEGVQYEKRIGSFLVSWDNVSCYLYDESYIFLDNKEKLLTNFVIVKKDFSVAEIILSKADYFGTCSLHNILLTICKYNSLYAGRLLVHASAVVYNNIAILFCGQSGIGKSTQASLWLNIDDAFVLNYDRPCLFRNGNQFFASGSPWSGKERCYINQSFPVSAIVFISQSNVNRIEKLNPSIASMLLFEHFLLYPICEEVSLKYSNFISDIAESVDIYHQDCTKDLSSVETTFSTIFGHETLRFLDKRIDKKMKINNSYMLKNIADEWVVFPRGKNAIENNNTVILNETGAFLWQMLESNRTEDELVTALCSEYDLIDNDIAQHDVRKFIDKLTGIGALE